MNRTYDLVLESICAALITICSWISLTVMEIPFTLQTFGILLVLYSIGGKRGTIAILVYILLGVIGVPVFAGFKSGPAAVMGPTGGFIIGFVIAGLIYWLIDSRWLGKYKKKASSRMLISIVEGIIFEIILYTFGVIWFVLIYTRNTGAIGIGSVLAMCVVPFIIPDIIKLLAAASLRLAGIVKQR